MSRWSTVRLGDILTIRNGFAFDSKKFGETGKPLIRIRNLKDGSVTETRFSGEYDPVYVVKPGDLLVGMDGEFRTHRWSGAEALLNQRVCRLENFRDDVSSEFIEYGLNRFLSDIEERTTFTTVKHISAKQILAIQFPLPPFDEQKRIVAKLDDVTNLAAKASERQKKSVALASQIRKRYVDEAVKNLLEQASLYRLEEVATLIRGPFGGSLKKSMFVNAGFAVYEQKHAIAGDLSGVRYWIDNSKYEEMIRFSIRPGDTLMSCSGTIGRIVRVQPEDTPGLINQALLLVRPHAIIEPEMLTLLMESEYFQEKVSVGVTGSAMKNVASVRELKKIVIPVPVRSEQLRFIAAVAEYSSVGSHLHDVAVRRHSLTSSLSARLLESAFAGDF